MSIAKRVWVFAVFCVLALLGSIGVSLYQSVQIERQQAFIGASVFPSLRGLRDITEYVGEYRRILTVFNRVAGTPEEQKQKVIEGMASNAQKLDKAFEDYESHVVDAEERRLLTTTRSLWKDFYTAASDTIPLAQQHQDEALEAKRVVVRKTGADFLKALQNQVEFTSQQQLKSQQSVERSVQQSIYTLLTLALAATALMAYLGWQLYQRVALPLGTLSQIIVRVKDERNLTLRAPVGAAASQDEVSQALTAFNALMNDFSEEFSALAKTSRSLSTDSDTLHSAAEQVADTVATQSASSGSIAAATQELTVSISHVAARATDTRHESEKVGELAQRGQGAIEETTAEIGRVRTIAEQTMACMTELETRANEVEKIVGVVRGLADQTNLLALNAAIEAARAGENGRGFAVVADEVRKLAEHTTKSTQEIATTIERIIAGAESATHSAQETASAAQQGVARAEIANQTIREINSHTQVAITMVEEISDALAEQTSAATAIAQQIEQVATLTDTCREASDQTRDTASGLNTLAHEMQHIVTRYQVA